VPWLRALAENDQSQMKVPCCYPHQNSQMKAAPSDLKNEQIIAAALKARVAEHREHQRLSRRGTHNTILGRIMQEAIDAPSLQGEFEYPAERLIDVTMRVPNYCGCSSHRERKARQC
jgi:hypothetical protein